jgi:cytochrome c-type biogenesis protein CcmH/NrfF
VLALRYGPRALDMLRDGSTTFLLFLVPPCLLFLAFLVIRRLQRRSTTLP